MGDVSCFSDHPYRLLPAHHLPSILSAEVYGLTSSLDSVLSCLVLESGTKVTGLIELLGETILLRLKLTQKLLDLITDDHVYNC